MWELAAVLDGDCLLRVAVWSAEEVDFLYYPEGIDDFSEYDVGAVESLGSVDHHNVELTRVCILLPTIRHSHLERFIMPMNKIFIRKVPPIYTIPTCAVSIRDITTLTQVKRDDPVELTTLVVQLFP